MLERFKAAVPILPALAVASVGLVYLYAWALFRAFDGSWVGSLSPGDIFSMGWALLPGLAAGLVFSEVNVQTAEAAGTIRINARYGRFLNIVRGVCGLAVIVGFVVSFFFPFASELSPAISRAYLTLSMVSLALFAHASVALLEHPQRQPNQFHRRSVLVFALGAVLMVDAFGGILKSGPASHLIELEENKRICATVVFTGQNAIYIYDPANKVSLRVERRLLRAAIKQPVCDGRRLNRVWFTKDIQIQSNAVTSK